MFILSKIFWLVFSPTKLVFLGLLVGTLLLFTRYRRAGRYLVAAGMGAWLFVGIFPVGDAFTEILENRFPANPALPVQVDGIVVLGGTVNPLMTDARGQPSVTDGNERLIEFIHLARMYPAAKLVFSGGSGALSQQHLKETTVAKAVFDRLGFDASRVFYENRSRNTHENAAYSLEWAKPTKGENWLLITSARHMPRAVGSFRAAGWTDLIPYPVDYATFGTGDFTLSFDPFGGLKSLDGAVREWIGLLVYRLLGRTGDLFPGPGSVGDN